MRITKDYGLTSSKLEHDLLASIDKSMRDDARKRRKKAPASKPEDFCHAFTQMDWATTSINNIAGHLLREDENN